MLPTRKPKEKTQNTVPFLYACKFLRIWTRAKLSKIFCLCHSKFVKTIYDFAVIIFCFFLSIKSCLWPSKNNKNKLTEMTATTHYDNITVYKKINTCYWKSEMCNKIVCFRFSPNREIQTEMAKSNMFSTLRLMNC